MGRHGLTLPRVCAGCGKREMLSTAAARTAGWKLWEGGGFCKRCRELDDKKEDSIAKREPLPFDAPEIFVQEVTVECDECHANFHSTNEHVDGFRPGIHWLVTEENKRKLREEKQPIPLCPGVRRAGKVITATKTEEPRA